MQNVAELGGTDGLTEDTPEACCLCEHLDRVFLYGLREPQWGYWPWVRQFTHPAAQREITGCSGLSTELGYGRAWLLASLNGALLEGYMRSFRQNQRLLHRGYSASSFLRHPQHLELLATVVSGLEHVPFKLNPNNPLLDDTSAWWKLAQLWLATGELPQGFSGMTVSWSASSASSSSCREEDSGIHSASLASPAEEVPEPCRCADCAALGDRERIRRIISMDDPDEDLEVTRVILTRRRRGVGSRPLGRGPACGGEESAGGTQAASAQEATPATSLGAPGALPGGLAPWERTDDTERFAGTSPCARDSGCFELAEDDRGAPDGCEGGGLHEAPLAWEEMFSIYDGHGKGGAGLSALKEEPKRPCSPEERTPVASPLGEEELPTETGTKEGLDIEVENCALLYLTLQVFGSEDEKLYKAFLAWQWAAEGQLEPAYVVLTNECLYTLRPGPEVNQFACGRCLRFSQLEVVTVWLNYQGFSLTCASGDRLELATAHAELTRNILSSLDVAMRRNRQALPSVVGHCSEQLDALQRLLASELKLQGGQLRVRDYRLVHWEPRAQRGSSPSCPPGPSASGPLMWRLLEDPSARAHGRRKKGPPWQAGHFLLRAGVLYRFANQGDTVADATYLVSGFPGASCRAVSSVGRPHALQLGLSSSGACLQLAASNQADLKRWLRALSEAQSHGPARSVGCLVACCLVLAGDLVLTLVEGRSRVLGRGAVVDLSAVHSEANFCVLEFESGEAERESCAHSWLFWFATAEEKEQFLAVVSACWQEIFQVSLDVLPLSNGSLRNHCLARASQLERRLTELKEFCLDS